uniref:T-cell surface glycoprotein CD4 n=1 Tax=Jaculus jaculus TaxID=51337 RepID=A0A8C5K2N0_JACJA
MHRGLSIAHLLLALQLAQLPAVPEGKTDGRTVVLGKAGDPVELPCEASRKMSLPFTWKHSNDRGRGALRRGSSHLKDRVDSKKSMWDQGSFPLIINKLEVKDSGTYICEMQNRRTEVELQVFKVTVNPGTHLLQGQNLTLTLESPSRHNPSAQCKRPGNRIVSGAKVLFAPNVGFQDSGPWQCTLTQDRQSLTFDIHISVLGFQKTHSTAYKKEGEPVEFCFPLNFEEETLHGELRWQAEKAPASKSWITFSLENKKVSVKKSTQDPSLQLADTLPLCLKLPKVLPQYAGSGTLTLNLTKGTLIQEVKLVVMRVTQSPNSLMCEVWGPTSPKLKLSLMLENQEPRVSKQEKVIQVQAPAAGLWRCRLSDGDEMVMDSETQVLPAEWNQDQPMFLAIVLGGTFGFLAFAGLCILCCVKCRHKRRQAERMSQIKRLLSEKKTCQCPHRLRKTQNLM